MDLKTLAQSSAEKMWDAFCKRVGDGIFVLMCAGTVLLYQSWPLDWLDGDSLGYLEMGGNSLGYIDTRGDSLGYGFTRADDIPAAK